MKKTTEFLQNYEGTSYEVGEQIASFVLSQPSLLQTVLLPKGTYPQDKLLEIQALLDLHCPGINEEIKGFSDTLSITPEQVLFYAMTYLERGCSLMALLPCKTNENHTLMARNYDFNDSMEEMCFAYTNINGKHKYIASTLNLFGRCDGMNEHGLAVCKASIGLPVGNFEGGQKAGTTGFSFWVVVRSILENCKTVRQAIDWTMAAPIGYNINLLLANSDEIALVESINGNKSFRMLREKEVTAENPETFLSATNHVVLPELKKYELMKIENSSIRNKRIHETLSAQHKVSKASLKKLLSTSYPEGLCCHYYPEFFGTLRSMIFDCENKTVEVAFGSPQANRWHTFPVAKLPTENITVSLPIEKANTNFYAISPENAP